MMLRLDQYLVEKGLVKSREKARAYIMAGDVSVDGNKVNKAGFPVHEGAEVSLISHETSFVSRGGLKLDKALSLFPIDFSNRIAVDIGASTGGFTDCMLQHGAQRVYAVDVGYGQLEWKLRNDERVMVLERRNARYMESTWFDMVPTFAAIDVSFISLKLILLPLAQCMPDGSEVVALIKPQFEAGRADVGKHGVVRDAAVHTRVCEELISFSLSAGYSALGLIHSPVTGPKGNIEFLLWLACEQSPRMNIRDVRAIVQNAHIDQNI